ncbi:fumarylacetoacetate hydrolase family protein [Novosphingobium fluoreni]|uniref:fumarylacetoacetate hydrolase family protein n=1 Tax=Novosphingobium fluoreni TaxID=1391222 RepID=UPI003DA05F82
MKLARMEWDGRKLWAEIVDGKAYESGEPRAPRERGALLGPVCEGRLLAPIMPHNKVIGLMDNFDGRKDRMGPGLFIKPMSTVIADGDVIRVPDDIGDPNQEAELGVVIGRTTRRVSVEEALDHVLGYVITNDVTCFPVLEKDGFASLSIRFKMYDDFMPIGPWIDAGFDPAGRALRSFVNGELKQAANLDDMAFNVAEVISWASRVMTLDPGDIISMGTCPGFVPLKSGDIVRCEIEGLGVIENRLGQA